jgi:hypothetical protein
MSIVVLVEAGLISEAQVIDGLQRQRPTTSERVSERPDLAAKLFSPARWKDWPRLARAKPPEGSSMV